MEVATTDSEGNPTAMRIELRNAGEAAIDMPIPEIGCGGLNGGILIQFRFQAADGTEKGFGCGGGGVFSKTLLERVHSEWLRLEPDEYFVFTENVRYYVSDLGTGRLTYWAEYDPPSLSQKEKEELRGAGFFFPDDQIMTAPATVETR
jgi:hypothetical protein